MNNCEYAQRVKRGMSEYLKCTISNKDCKFTRYCIHERSVKNTDNFTSCVLRKDKKEGD